LPLHARVERPDDEGLDGIRIRDPEMRVLSVSFLSTSPARRVHIGRSVLADIPGVAVSTGAGRGEYGGGGSMKPSVRGVAGRVRSLSIRKRVGLASALSALAAAILVAGPARVSGQWADHCQHRVGRTHAELVASLAFGAIAFFVGYDYDHNRLHVGQVMGGVVAVGAVVTYFILVGRGCGT
jgi:hypothetical protein